MLYVLLEMSAAKKYITPSDEFMDMSKSTKPTKPIGTYTNTAITTTIRRHQHPPRP